MKTKAELIEELKELSRDIWILRNDSKRETEEAKRQKESESNSNAMLQSKSDEKSKILNLVVEILAGDASPSSKTEVLIDLFPEIKQFKENKKKTIHSEYMVYQYGRF